MKKKYENAVRGVLKDLDKFIHETLLGKPNGRRAWLVSKTERGAALPMFKVYVRIPYAPSLLNTKGEVIKVDDITGKNALDIATVESNPTAEGMGSLFFDEVENIARGRNIKYLRVESVLAPELERMLVKRGYTGPPGSGCSFWKQLA
jgi:hypothetical protein